MTAITIKTEANYHTLMRKLEANGYKWRQGERPTQYNGWSNLGVTISLQPNKRLTVSSASYSDPHETISYKEYMKNYIDKKNSIYITYKEYLKVKKNQ